MKNIELPQCDYRVVRYKSCCGGKKEQLILCRATSHNVTSEDCLECQSNPDNIIAKITHGNERLMSHYKARLISNSRKKGGRFGER